MDIVAACRVFVRAAERGSITLGAASIDVQQSVASRRVAALEARFGAPLFERTARSVVLTPFGRDMLAPARRLVQLADAMDADAERARARPISIAVPTTCSVRELAVLDAEARDVGIALDVVRALPEDRVRAVRNGSARVAVVSVPEDLATWTVRLGLGSREPAGTEPVALGSLRPSRHRGTATHGGGVAGRRIRLMPEDDLPHLRDVIVRAGAAAGLLAGQIVTDASEAAAVSAVLRDGDLVLCSADEARAFDLSWRPLAEPALVRGFSLAAEASSDADTLRGQLSEAIASALGGEVRS
jgi:DNA-binding transcriptional LysR family regulator